MVRSLFVVAGEPSGDTHAAGVIAELRRLAPDLSVEGLGGRRMAAAGARIHHDLAAAAIMGFFPVLAALPRMSRLLAETRRRLEAGRPDAVVLVDYPGFNLRVAAHARRLGLRVVWYISPQVWAWAPWRTRRIARLVDRMLCILPFEPGFYERSGVRAEFTGHPLFDHIESLPRNAEAAAALREGRPRVLGIFPGSRPHVVASLLPVFIRAAARVRAAVPDGDLLCLVAAADASIAGRIRSRVGGDPLFRVVDGRPHDVAGAADVCLTASGTTTLELAWHDRPMVIGYRVSALSWLPARLLVRVRHIGLVNLVTPRPFVPEHVGVRDFSAAAARDVAGLFTNQAARAAQLEGLARVREALRCRGAYRTAALRILDAAMPPGTAAKEARPPVRGTRGPA